MSRKLATIAPISGSAMRLTPTPSMLRYHGHVRPRCRGREALPRVLEIVGMDQVEGAASHQLRGGVAEQAGGGGAGVHDLGVGVDQGYCVVTVLDERSEACLARAQHLLRPLGGGDVVHQRQPGDDRALLVPQRPRVDGKPVAPLRDLRCARCPRQGPPEQRLEHRMHVGWQGLGERLALERVAPEAPRPRALRQDEAELAVEQRQRAVGEVAGERPVERGDVARRSRPRGFSAGYAAPAHCYLPPVRDSAMGRDGIEPST